MIIIYHMIIIFLSFSSLLQNVTTPEVRGTAFAVFTLTDDLGKGLGPLMIVALIDAFGHNRRTAFNLDGK